MDETIDAADEPMSTQVSVDDPKDTVRPMASINEEPQVSDVPAKGISESSIPKSSKATISSYRSEKSFNSGGPLPTQIFDKGQTSKSNKGISSKSGRVSRKKSAFSVAKIEQTKAFKAVSVVALVIALFGGGLMTLCDVPDDPATVLQDVIMITVTVFFIVELVWKFIVDKIIYRWSFFFWMDLLGTVSMIFEISFLLGTAGKMDEGDMAVNTVLLRTARAAKVGARAGRLTKVVKVISLLYWRTFDDQDNGDANSEARVLNAKLMTTLSTKVSMLTVVLIMGVPLFNIGRYPEDDLSLRSWCERLESDYKQAYNMLDYDAGRMTTNIFEEAVEELQAFYSDLPYYPYKLQGFPRTLVINGEQKEIPGESDIQDDIPKRKSNIVLRTVSSCRIARANCREDKLAAIYFNFKAVRQYEAGMDMILVVFIVLCMVAESADLSATLDRMVVKPLERMLGTVRMMAQVLSLVTSVDPNAGDDEDFEDSNNVEPNGPTHQAESTKSLTRSIKNEAELLENVFAKLAKLTAVFMQNSIADEVVVDQLEYESKAVIFDVMGLGDAEAQRVASVVKTNRKLMGPVVIQSPYTPEQIASWDLDLQNMLPEHREKVVLYAFFDSAIGAAASSLWVDVATFRSYFLAVRSGYLENPYHNFTHAVDVFLVVWRIITSLQCTDWVSDVDLCSLLLAALAHDIGHMGMTNPFLIETMHELAMRYNDKSPLENMHVSKMFGICTDQASNVFKRFNKDAYKQARKVCITTILHTDNSLHFDMVKDIKKLYEMTSDICDMQAKQQSGELGMEYMSEVLTKDVVLLLKLILHMGDISTPLKPFEISKAWAFRVQDEFFAQGDEEKKLGIPVGMLNDRDKVNRFGAEHGFIVFLVSPLLTSAIGIFPALQYLADQMAVNVESWRNLWVEDTSPAPDELKKRDADVQKIKDQVKELRNRNPIVTVRNTPDAKQVENKV